MFVMSGMLPMKFEIRFGTPEDIGAIVGFILEAGGGLFEQILEDVVPGVPLPDLIALAVTEDTSPFSFRNCLIAESQSACTGLALCYPAAQYGLPAMADGVVPEARLEPVRAILNSRIDNSYYLNTLAVAPEAAGQGLARLLLEMSGELGKLAGFATLSLHTWSDNEAALRLYQSIGFEVVELIAVGSTASRLRYRGPMALMAMPIDALLAARIAASPA